MLILDNTKRSTFCDCPRKFYYKHIRNYETGFGSSAIRYGVVFHAMLETYYDPNVPADVNRFLHAITEGKKTWEVESEGKEFWQDYRTLENAVECFTQYIENYADMYTAGITKTERTFNNKISVTAEDQKRFPWIRDFIFAGKIDAELERDGLLWNVEYKTTGQPLALQEKRLKYSPQIMGYQYQRLSEGKPVAGTFIVLHQIRANKLKSGDYGKLTCKFALIPISYTDADLEDWKEGLVATAARIQHAEDHNFYPKDEANCFKFGLCQYRILCNQSNFGNEVAAGFTIGKPWDEEITC